MTIIKTMKMMIIMIIIVKIIMIMIFIIKRDNDIYNQKKNYDENN